MNTRVYKHGGDSGGKKIRLDFSVNVNPMGLPEGVARVLADSIDSFAAYPDITSRELLTAISKEEGIAAGQIVLGAGASELIMAVAHAYAGKRVLLQCPFFGGYERAFLAAGCELHYADAGEGYQPKSDTAELIRRYKPDVYVIGNPSNPVGICPDESIMKETVSSCAENGSLLLADEVFLGFIGDAKSYTEYFKSGAGIVSLKAFTKLYSFAGLRLGYALCSDRELAENIAMQLPEWNISVPAQVAGVQALKEKEYLEDSLSLIGQEREYLSVKLKELGMRVFPSEADFIFFESPVELYVPLIDKGILIRDCSDHRGIRGQYSCRIAVRKHEDNMQLISEIKEIVNGT